MFRICLKAEAALHQTAVGCGGICKRERRLEKKESSSYRWGRASLESHILLLWSVNQANSQTGSRCTPTKLCSAAPGPFSFKNAKQSTQIRPTKPSLEASLSFNNPETGRRSSSALGRDAFGRRHNVNIGPSSSLRAINQRRRQLTGENEAMGTLFFQGPQPIPLLIGFPVTEEQAS